MPQRLTVEYTRPMEEAIRLRGKAAWIRSRCEAVLQDLAAERAAAERTLLEIRGARGDRRARMRVADPANDKG